MASWLLMFFYNPGVCYKPRIKDNLFQKDGAGCIASFTTTGNRFLLFL